MIITWIQGNSTLPSHSLVKSLSEVIIDLLLPITGVIYHPVLYLHSWHHVTGTWDPSAAILHSSRFALSSLPAFPLLQLQLLLFCCPGSQGPWEVFVPGLLLSAALSCDCVRLILTEIHVLIGKRKEALRKLASRKEVNSKANVKPINWLVLGNNQETNKHPEINGENSMKWTEKETHSFD